jgi:hypothetical protein
MHEKHIFLLVKRAYPDGNKKARTHSASISQPLPSNITVGYVFKRQTGGVGTFCCQNPPQKEDFTQGQRSTLNPASASEMLSNNINISMHSNTKRRGGTFCCQKNLTKNPHSSTETLGVVL